MDADLAFALELANLADSITLPRFRAADLKVETKPDLTPVTDADRAVEEALRERIAHERPGEAVLGEEYGVDGDGPARWILDPVDGTRNYARGIPIFATLIAFERAGELVVGAVSAPALGRRWWAARGRGAFADGSPIRVSSVERIEDAVFSYSRSGLVDPIQREAVVGLALRAWHARTFSDFWQHMLVAQGSADVALDHAVELWDLAASKVIVEEAGGRFTDFDGRARPDGGTAISSNGLLHDEALGALQAARTASS